MSHLKFAVRMLVKSPVMTVAAIASLALGIGANAAIFSLFDQMLLKPLPVEEPARLVNLLAPGPKPGQQQCNQASTSNCDDVFSYRMFRDLEHAQTVFTGLAAHRLFGANLSSRNQTLSGDGMLVSGSYFPVLGLHSALGRLIGPDDDRAPGDAPVVVLSHAYWRDRFDADPGVVDQVLTVNGTALTIVGVAPPGFGGTTIGAEPKVFVPLTLRTVLEPTWVGFEDRRSYVFYLFGRLKPGVSREQARAALNPTYHTILTDVEAPLQQGMSAQTLARFRDKPLVLEPGGRGQSGIPNRSAPVLRVLLGVTTFVLLIACANVANLLLTRAVDRSGEMAIRLAIGASRWDLIGQLLTESAVLAVAGALVGVLVASGTLGLMHASLPAFATEGLDWRIDRTVLLVAGSLALATGLLFGLFPAIHSTRPDLASPLKAHAGQPSGGRAAARFRSGLASTQVAVCLTLLVAAGLFTKSLANLSRVDLGMQLEHVITFGVAPALNGYTPERTQTFFTRLEDKVSALPGVTGVTSALVAVLAGNNWGNDVTVEGFRAGPDTDTNARYNEVGAAYFATMGVPLVAGRDFTRDDAKGAAKVAIVNEAFVRKFNLGHDAVGKRMGEHSVLDTEIVGVVRDAKYSEVKQTIPPIFFRPYRQGVAPQIGSLAFYVRTALAPDTLLAAVPKVVATLDPNLPVTNLETMDEQIRQNVFLDRFVGLLSVGFAVLATLLAAVGLYGVLAYTVSQRTREIGLRIALGATPTRVHVMVLRQVGTMVVVGGAIGLAAAVGLGQLAQSLLFGLKGSDPVILSGAVVALGAVALAAGFVPARRAARIDPMRALRCE